MALDQANQKPIQRDSAGQPAPQVFNPDTNEYEVAVGTGGRQHTILYTADGNPVDLTTLLGAIQSASEATKAAVEGTLVTQLSGSSAAEDSLTEADAVANVITFDAPVTAIEIVHSEETRQTFIVNGISLKVHGGGWRSPVGGTPAATVTLPSGVTGVTVTRLE